MSSDSERANNQSLGSIALKVSELKAQSSFVDHGVDISFEEEEKTEDQAFV